MSWLSEVGEHTKEHREQRALDLMRKASRRKWDLRQKLWSEVRVRDAQRWYLDRARGQRERIARVEECGADVLQIICNACGLSHERPTGCRVGILCLRCRSAIARTKRAIFQRARQNVLAEASNRGLLWPARARGRYGEKFLTLTAPHVRGDSVAARIARVFDAWPAFLKLLNAAFRKQAVKSAEWFRVFEWTIGDDQHGHPHIHVWLFCQFLPLDLLREWWASALRSAGCPLASGASPIIHIREIDDDDGGAQELIKYLTKDITSSGEKLPPWLYAEVYKALDGRRITQASRGFMDRANRESVRCECGADLPRRVRRIVGSPRPSSPKTTRPGA